MRGRVAAGVATFVTLAAVSGASAGESTIYPGVGIGKVKLGMSEAQVKRALGSSYSVDVRKPGYLELGWNFASWSVGFRKGRAVLVSTTVRGQRTSTGAGPGALWPEVMRAYPGGRCTFVFTNYFWRAEYLVPHSGGTQTLFVFKDVYDEAKGQTTGYVVTEATVRTPYTPLPEFQPGWRDGCAAGWAKATIPRQNHH
jgi:hypothetical protein